MSLTNNPSFQRCYQTVLTPGRRDWRVQAKPMTKMLLSANLHQQLYHISCLSPELCLFCVLDYHLLCCCRLPCCANHFKHLPKVHWTMTLAPILDLYSFSSHQAQKWSHWIVLGMVKLMVKLMFLLVLYTCCQKSTCLHMLYFIWM